MSTAIDTLPSVATLPNPAEAAFSLAQRQAKALASSELVPQAYRNNLPNVLLALEVANRIGATPFAVMQNLHLIQGRPSWSSSFLIATVNACGRFDPLRFEIEGDDPKAKTFRVRAYAKDKASGEVCRGAWITWAMADAEGWSKKTGSKWLTMPEQMFMYRAAAFWARLFAPEVSLGIQTAEEVTDVYATAHVVEVPAPTNQPGSIDALKTALLGDESSGTAADDKPLQVDPDTGEVLPPELQS